MTSPTYRASLFLFLAGCLQGCGAAPSDAAQDPGPVGDAPGPEPAASCPADSGGELSVDGQRIEVTRVLGDTTTIGNAVQLQLVSVGADGREKNAFVTLDSLTRGRSTKLSPSTSVEYREYAPQTTPQPPTFLETSREGTLSGSIDVIRIATEPDDVTCGTFALVTTGLKAIVVKGRFRVKLLGPQPG
jgi:hypothetical protein